MTDDDAFDVVDNDASSNVAPMTFQLFIAKTLGYLVGFGSLMLYTPIAIRICRQKHADGLVISTWWLKLSSYILSDVYYVRKKYNLSTYVETVIITIESIVILFLVAFYQRSITEVSFWFLLAAFVLGSIYGFTVAPNSVILLGQLSSVFINSAALIPQFHHNYTKKTKGDYSPLTTSLASAGCLVRMFTTVTLNHSDPVLMISFLSAFIVNIALLIQILYYGIRVEGLNFLQIFMSDVVTTDNNTTTHQHHDFYDGIVDGDPLTTIQRQEHAASKFQGHGHVHSESNSALRRRSALELPETSSRASNEGGDNDCESDNSVDGKSYGSCDSNCN